ncbi:MAG TPA: hypothetical protein VE967_06260 [Gemmatimonadaceae bacterium]|nr:hypothetical protein [Gemmatimonadaceae bacterium]
MTRSTVTREGVVAGILGASAVAVWFFAADMIAGTPLHTPLLLAHAAYGVFGGTMGSAVAAPVLAYTALHYAVFIGIGVVMSVTLSAVQRRPGHFAGLFLLFAVFEAGFYGLCLMLSAREVLGAIAWYQIGAANLIASVLMGFYLFAKHPGAVHQMDAALKGVTN